MIRFIRDNYLPIIVLVVVAFDEIFHALLLVVGASETSGVKQYGAMALAITIYAILFKNLLGGRIFKKEIRVIAFCVIILFLYIFSSLIYGAGQDKYITYLLCLGAECIPAAYVGVLFSRYTNWGVLNKWLPFVVIFTTVLLGIVVVKNAALGIMLKDTSEDSGGMNYQTVSYYMSFSYSYCCYYVFYSNVTKTLLHFWLKIACSILMFLSVLASLASGGRGALVVIFVVSFYMLLDYLKSSKFALFKVGVIFALLLPVVLYLVSYFEIMETAGMGRIMDNMTDSSTRSGLYSGAINAFLDSPLWGNGLGSVFGILGIYSHNFVLDFLVEVGLIGTFFILVFLYKTYRKLRKLSKIEPVCMFFLIVFISTIVNHSFSNYWAAAMKLFMICSFVYSIQYIQYNEKKNNILSP